jgi:uncharacterized LabA/DUF88 family protein
MSRLAIFIDGAYLNKMAQEYGVWVDFEKLSAHVLSVVQKYESCNLSLVRTYYYDSLPYMCNRPTEEEKKQHAGKYKFFDRLRAMSRFTVREGQANKIGEDRSGNPLIQQKQVDLLFGLDVALLSGKGAITHAVLITGDNDFVPAVKAAQNEGVTVFLLHGPEANKEGNCTYSKELWQTCDERASMTEAFFEKVKRGNG